MKLQQILIFFSVFYILLLLFFFRLINYLILMSQLPFQFLYSFILLFYYLIFLVNFIVPIFNLLFEKVEMLAYVCVLSLSLLLVISLGNKTFIESVCHSSFAKGVFWLMGQLVIS